MRENELLPLPDLRRQIHDLVVTKRSTGLSPPEEKLLLYLEAKELHQPEQSDDCPGIFIYEVFYYGYNLL